MPLCAASFRASATLLAVVTLFSCVLLLTLSNTCIANIGVSTRSAESSTLSCDTSPDCTFALIASLPMCPEPGIS